MDSNATYVNLVLDGTKAAMEWPRSWLLKLPANPLFLEFVAQDDETPESRRSHFDFSDPGHIKHLIAYCCICIAYASFGDIWLSSLKARTNEVWQKTLNLVLHGLIEACELKGVSEDDTADIFLSLVEGLIEEEVSCREEFEDQVPDIFQSLLREAESPAFKNVNEEAQRLIIELESGTYSRWSEAASVVMERIWMIKEDVSEVVKEMDRA